MKWLLSLLGKSKDGKGVITELAENIDRFVNTPEDKKEVLKMVIDDRKSARLMYQNDSTLQKIFAIFFLISWAALTYFLLQHFAFKSISLEDWQIAFVGTIYGALNTKLSTIIDFLFGGSSADNKKKGD